MGLFLATDEHRFSQIFMTQSITQKSVIELELDDGELLTLRERLVTEKAALQSQLTGFKAQLAGRLPNVKYQGLMRQRAAVVQQLMEKEREIGELNEQRKVLGSVKEFRKSQESTLKVADIRSLVALRDGWHEFSMDDAHAPVERRLAFKFSQELRAFLKPYFAKTEVSA